MVEPRIVVPVVVGSSPTTHPAAVSSALREPPHLFSRPTCSCRAPAVSRATCQSSEHQGKTHPNTAQLPSPPPVGPEAGSLPLPPLKQKTPNPPNDKGAILPLAVGRRNSLFIGSPEVGRRAAIQYAKVRECRRVKADIEAWLTAVLRRLPDYRGDYVDLLTGMLELPEAGGGDTNVKA